MFFSIIARKIPIHWLKTASCDEPEIRSHHSLETSIVLTRILRFSRRTRGQQPLALMLYAQPVTSTIVNNLLRMPCSGFVNQLH